MYRFWFGGELVGWLQKTLTLSAIAFEESTLRKKQIIIHLTPFFQCFCLFCHYLLIYLNYTVNLNPISYGRGGGSEAPLVERGINKMEILKIGRRA